MAVAIHDYTHKLSFTAPSSPIAIAGPTLQDQNATTVLLYRSSKPNYKTTGHILTFFFTFNWFGKLIFEESIRFGPSACSSIVSPEKFTLEESIIYGPSAFSSIINPQL